MGATDGAIIQAAYEQAAAGNVEPLVSLFDASLEWRGRPRGHLWWRSAPS